MVLYKGKERNKEYWVENLPWWGGIGWPTECFRVSPRAKNALGTAVDKFPQVTSYETPPNALQEPTPNTI